MRSLICAAAALMISVGSVSAANGPRSSGVLFSGVTGPGPSGTKHVVSDAEAARDAQLAERGWLQAIRGRTTTNLYHVFPCRIPDGFESALTRTSTAYGFEVKSVSCHESQHFAPLVVIQSADYVQVAHALGPVRTTIDPRGQSGYTYPLFIEAVDGQGVPYVAAFNFGNAGGQWARADALYPFLHG
jgi:hypothetical protein